MRLFILLFFTLFCTLAFAGLPPTTFSGGLSTSTKKTTFNFQAPFSQATQIQGVTSRIETGSENILPNPNFEAKVLNWITFLGTGTVQNTTSSPIAEKQSMEIIDGGTGGYTVATSGSVAIPGGFSGINGQFFCRFKNKLTSSVTIFMSAQDNGANVLGSVTFTLPGAVSAPVNQLQGFNFIYNSTMTAITPLVQIVTGAGDVLVDDCYVGPAINIGFAMPAANIFASATIPQGVCTGVFSENTSSGITNFVNLGTAAGCPPWTTTGNITTTTGSTSFTLSNFVPANYDIEINGSMSSNALGSCAWRLTDGTHNYTSQQQGNGASVVVSPILRFHIPASDLTGGNVTYTIQAADNQASGCQIDATSNGTMLSIYIYQFPTKAQQSVWTMACPYDGSCVNEFSVKVDTSCTSTPCTITTQNTNWVSSISRASTGNYTVNFSSGLFSVAPSCFVTSSAQGNQKVSTSTSAYSFTTESTGSFVDASFDVQCSRQGTDIKPVYNAPVFVGSVISSSTTGASDIEAVSFGGATEPSVCSSSPCTMYRNTPGITSVTRTGAGLYTVNFASGTFSSPPVCTSQHTGFPFSGWTQRQTGTVPTTTTYKIQTIVNSTTGDGGAVDVICFGAH